MCGTLVGAHSVNYSKAHNKINGEIMTESPSINGRQFSIFVFCLVQEPAEAIYICEFSHYLLLLILSKARQAFGIDVFT